MKIETVAIIGLGYVGLPLACALSKHLDVVGFDISTERIDSLKKDVDTTGEVESEVLAAASLKLTNDPDDIRNKSCYIITVPTPVDEKNMPELGPIFSACKLVGQVMGKGAIITLESTVYPGVTEDECGRELEKYSRMVCGDDFFLGYSPERINPGDKTHTLEKIVKVVAGQTDEVAQALADMYGKVTRIFIAKDIKTAEAAKVIENAQRDINIAFVNELSIIFDKLGIDTHATLEAAGTKWNFIDFKPGLVGGHCIGVDPYYLTFVAERAGYHPEVILAGRKINDNMGRFVTSTITTMLHDSGLAGPILALGLTFKENVRDIRNSKSIDVIKQFISNGFNVDVYDPLANPKDVLEHYDIRLTNPSGKYCGILLLVAHDEFAGWDADQIESYLMPGGVVADIKGLWADRKFSTKTKVWSL